MCGHEGAGAPGASGPGASQRAASPDDLKRFSPMRASVDFWVSALRAGPTLLAAASRDASEVRRAPKGERKKGGLPPGDFRKTLKLIYGCIHLFGPPLVDALEVRLFCRNTLRRLPPLRLQTRLGVELSGPRKHTRTAFFSCLKV